MSSGKGFCYLFGTTMLYALAGFIFAMNVWFVLIHPRIFGALAVIVAAGTAWIWCALKLIGR